MLINSHTNIRGLEKFENFFSTDVLNSRLIHAYIVGS